MVEMVSRVGGSSEVTKLATETPVLGTVSGRDATGLGVDALAWAASSAAVASLSAAVRQGKSSAQFGIKPLEDYFGSDQKAQIEGCKQLQALFEKLGYAVSFEINRPCPDRTHYFSVAVTLDYSNPAPSQQNRPTNLNWSRVPNAATVKSFAHASPEESARWPAEVRDFVCAGLVATGEWVTHNVANGVKEFGFPNRSLPTLSSEKQRQEALTLLKKALHARGYEVDLQWQKPTVHPPQGEVLAGTVKLASHGDGGGNVERLPSDIRFALTTVPSVKTARQYLNPRASAERVLSSPPAPLSPQHSLPPPSRSKEGPR